MAQGSLTFQARYFDGASSLPHEVTVEVNREAGCLEFNVAESPRSYRLDACSLRPSIGRTEGALDLPDGGYLALPAPEAYAQLCAQVKGSRVENWADRLERHWRAVAASVLVLVLVVTAGFFWGIPSLAHSVAHALPDSATRAVSAETVRIMERAMLEDSGLSADRQAALRRKFDMLIEAAGMHSAAFDLRFRAAPEIGANAFALPSGVIYLLDDLVELAGSDEEILAVLAHEVGHVVHRHGLQSVLRSTGIFIMISAVLGDVTSMTSLATALPVMLAEARYSRGFEEEADQYAVELLLRVGHSPEPLADMLLRLAADGNGTAVPEALASHPRAARRAEAIRAASKSE